MIVLSVPTAVVQPMPDSQVTASSNQSAQSSTPADLTNSTTGGPPGTSETGIDNVTRLIEAHQSTLNNSIYEEQMEWDQVSAVSSQGIDFVPISLTSTTGANVSRTKLASEGVVNEYWVTENSTAGKTTTDYLGTQSASYDYHNSPLSFQDAGSETVRDWLNTSTYDFTGTITRNNRTLYEFWADGLRGDSTPIEDAHARVLIDEEGVIHEAVVTRIYSQGNETVAARLDYAVRRTGTTPPTRPDWVTAELPHLDASVIGNGTVIALEHTGGTNVSTATISTYFPDGPQSDTEIETFERGETWYLYRTEAAPDQILVSKNEAPSVNDSFIPVGGDQVFVSVFKWPAIFSEENGSLHIELEPRNR
jgi:hypothetical protein